MKNDSNSSLVRGVGLNDADYKISRWEGKQVWVCPFYMCWVNMLKRCYSLVSQKARPTYIGCSVVDEWLVFSGFKVWMEQQDWKGKHLDKDLISPGNKVYGPETCLFVDIKVNCFLIEKVKSNGLPVGVTHSQTDGRFIAQGAGIFTGNKHLGTFMTPEEAHQAWLSFKLEQAYILADLQTDERVSLALIKRYENYKSS